MRKIGLVIWSIFTITLMFSQDRISNKDILELKEFGFSEDFIKIKIKAFDPDFDISKKAIEELKKADFSNGIISLIVERQSKLQMIMDSTFYLISLELEKNRLRINGVIELQIGDTLQIYLPYNRSENFLTIMLKGVKIKRLDMEVNEECTKIQSVSYGIEPFKKANELPISKSAKKIAGKTFTITKISTDEYGEVQLEGLIEKKKYTAILREALILGELKLQKNKKVIFKKN